MRKIFTIILLSVMINSYGIAPTIASFSPTSGAIGSSVTINGTGFNTTAAQNVVFFGATKALVTAASATNLTVEVPLGATYEYISVTNLGVNLTAYSEEPFQVTCFCNTGFIPAFALGFYTLPIGNRIADIDGDGKPDLVGISSNNIVWIELNTSTPGAVSFVQNLYDAPVGQAPLAFNIGDIDGDGKPDLVVITADYVYVLLNTSTIGSPSFAPYVTISIAPYRVAGAYLSGVSIGDIDGDGRPDLAFIGDSNDSLCVLRNTSTVGNVSFASPVNFYTQTGAYDPDPLSLRIGDIDGDGKPDLAIANQGSSTIGVLRNTSTIGHISFANPVTFPTGTNPISISIGDIDGDGKPDLAVANQTSNTVSALRNTSSVGAISFANPDTFAVGANAVSLGIGDLDGDGKPDLVVANRDSNSVSVLRNTSVVGAISFASQAIFATGASPDFVSIGDIDGDGRSDIVVSNTLSNPELVLLQMPAPQGSLTANGPFCGAGTGKLTWTATAGTGPYVIVYNDGTANRTATNVESGVPFNVFTNPVTGTTTYTLASVTDSYNIVTTNGFSVSTSTITVNPIPTATIIASGSITFCQGDSVILTSSSANTYLWSNNATSQSTTIFNSGSYSVTTFSIGGCSASSTVTIITTNPLPAVPTISATGSTLTSSASTGNQWYANSAIISGASSQTYSAPQSGIYSVQVTDSDGCSSVSSPFNFTFSGIQEVAIGQSISVVPNPSNGKFSLEFGQIEPLEIKIYNSIGAIVYQSKDITTALDLSNQPKGNYFLLIQTPVSTVRKKFIIQ